MESILSDMVSGDALVSWLIIFFLVGYFGYKEWPEFKRRMSSDKVKEAKTETMTRTVESRLDAIEATVSDIKEKMDRDYRRINEIEQEIDRNKRDRREDREEMMLIMQALLASLRGLQQLNCNGPVTEEANRLADYIMRKAHDVEVDE